MNSSYDPEANAYYFESQGVSGPSVAQISLGVREVVADVDISGRIIGIEVL